jgi:hypothetical protein
MDPVRIGITAFLISRPRPMLNLFVFWLGGMAAGIATALVVLVFLRDSALSIMREVVSSSSTPIFADIQVAIGVLAVLIAARLRARQRAPVPVTGGGLGPGVRANTPIGSADFPSAATSKEGHWWSRLSPASHWPHRPSNTWRR